MNKPKFTVIIPLYNKAKHIARTLESIQKQRYPASEIIVVDDGSTDNGVEVVNATNLKNVRIIQQANGGVSSARNTGIALAQHEYIAFLDADDQWLPLYLDEIARLIEKFPQAAVFGTRYQIVEAGERYIDSKINIGNVDPTGVILDDFFDIVSKGDLPFMMSSTTIKKSLFDVIDVFPVGEPLGEDQDLFYRAALTSQIAYSNNVHLLYHRDVQNSACLQNIPDKECPFSIRLTQAAMSIEQDIEKKMAMLRYSAAHLCHIAKINISAGRFQQARALLADPRCKLKPKHLYGLYGLSWIKQVTGFCMSTLIKVLKVCRVVRS